MEPIMGPYQESGRNNKLFYHTLKLYFTYVQKKKKNASMQAHNELLAFPAAFTVRLKHSDNWTKKEHWCGSTVITHIIPCASPGKVKCGISKNHVTVQQKVLWISI